MARVFHGGPEAAARRDRLPSRDTYELHMLLPAPYGAGLTHMNVTVRPVRGRGDLREFIKLPFRLHRDTPWVPPLILERRGFLDREKNPFFEHAEAEYFIAVRDGQVVGRITAHVDERWTQFQGGNDGMFGFFESENDTETVRALVDAATDWLRQRGRERMLGPMDFTTNDECGLLIEGHERDPLVLEPWHPPYYRELVEGLGMTKTMDLLMWELYLGQLKQGDRFHDFIHEAGRKSQSEHGVSVRHMRKRDLEAEIARFMEVYNAAWGPNWGFVPITEEEVRFQAKNLKPILDENWAMIAEREGEVVGAALTLPDINQVLAKMNGRLLPFGWWHFLTGTRVRARRQARVPALRRRGRALRPPRRGRCPSAPEGR
jgi:hypothetical protein